MCACIRVFVCMLHALDRFACSVLFSLLLQFIIPESSALQCVSRGGCPLEGLVGGSDTTAPQDIWVSKKM
jgi:hypothetical protein